MNRLARCAPPVLAVAAVAFVVAGFFSELLDEPWWKLAVVVAGSVSCAIGWFVNRMHVMFPGIVALCGARVLVLVPAPLLERREDLGPIEPGASAVIGIGLVAMMAIAIRYRRGDLDQRDFIDFATVAIGASLGGWVLAASPLITDFDLAPPVAVLSATYLPISMILFTFIVDLLFTGLQRNAAMQLITLSALANLVGAAVSTLSMVELINVPRQAEIALYGAAFLFLAGGLSHHRALETVTRADAPGSSVAYTRFRLGMTAACLVVPGILVATIAPVGSIDVGVRITLLVALVATVVTRLSIALSSHENAKRTLLHRLHRDELTGLPTRAGFVAAVGDMLETTWRSEFRPTIIQLNLDRFKNINDSLGHDEANRVLVAVAERLSAVAARFDGAVARTGGDEFVIVDSSTRSDDEVMARVEAVRHALSSPVATDERPVFVTSSIGVAVAPRNRTVTAEELLRRADIATNTAKATGRSGLCVFDESMQSHLAQRMDVEHALHGAIGRQEMRLYHQAIVDIPTGEVSGFEALMRWQRDGTIVSPIEFIPIAEETGMINELGAWALNDALRELRGWIDDGVVRPHTTVSVNVSPRQITDPNFADIVRDALESNRVPANLLWLEMTESMMLDEPELAETTLRSIRELGVRLALDDFGTGYSSLSLLQQFPIQRIKIDRAFVQGIAERGSDRSLVRTIIAMAQSMGLDIVAEGVETVHQLQTLAELSCDKAQGYLISHPVPADAMRSTMIALDELSSLSLFGSSNSALHDLAHTHLDSALPTEFGPTAATPIGTSRPLGQPVF